MRCKFPYFEDRPHIPIVLEHENKRARFLPLLDSGADFSVFYRSDAYRLGLNWESGKDVTLNNADNSDFCAKQFDLLMDIEGMQFPVKICFIDNKHSSMPLLGRLGVFDRFVITIVEEKKFVELKVISEINKNDNI